MLLAYKAYKSDIIRYYYKFLALLRKIWEKIFNKKRTKEQEIEEIGMYYYFNLSSYYRFKEFFKRTIIS